MKEIDYNKLKEMLILGGETLHANFEIINSLNVFPVPDGDTGTNMNMTIQSGIKAIIPLNESSVSEVTKVFSKGLLLGARGNSGVILSQFFRGFSEGFENVNVIDCKTFSNALKEGKKRAYSSVIKAVEGTILTVIKDMAEFEYVGDNFLDYFNKLVACGQKSLDNTPNLLPILKEVGVVDSGGAGIIEIFKGMQASISGEKVKNTLGNNFETFLQTEEHPLDINNIVFGYCTEMLIEINYDNINGKYLDENKELDIVKVREKIATFGDSIVAIYDDGILKVHVHTEDVLEVFGFGQSLGDFVHIKSENMRIQARNMSGENIQKEEGIVSVVSSKEMAKLFASIYPIEPIIGGQTLNPSIEDIVKAIRRTNAKNVLIFPNNSNVVMAAKEAKAIIEDKNVEVIETKYMTQGFEALINYVPDISLEENKVNILKNLDKLINYEVAKATKDTKIGEVIIIKDYFLIQKEGEIVACVKEDEEVFNFIKNDLDLDDIDMLTLFVGEEGINKKVNKFIDEIEEGFEFLETKVYNTNQPIYSYLIYALKE